MGDYDTQAMGGIASQPLVMPLQIQNLPPIYTPPPTPGIPTIVNLSPALPGPIDITTPISLTALSEAGFERVVLAVSFPTLGLYEIIHDGDSFTDRYPATLGNARVPVTDGYQFTVLRREGWPASPRLIPFAFDTAGQTNDITGTIYAWTLVT